jgi:hypothetical protein
LCAMVVSVAHTGSLPTSLAPFADSSRRTHSRPRPAGRRTCLRALACAHACACAWACASLLCVEARAPQHHAHARVVLCACVRACTRICHARGDACAGAPTHGEDRKECCERLSPPQCNA